MVRYCIIRKEVYEMAVPEGYTALARIGYADKGNYAAGTTYMTGDVVYHNGSSYVALKDNLKGVTPVNGNDWKYLARGFAAETMADVQATDTSGVLGTAGAQVVSQSLIDAIADRVMTKLIATANIANNGLVDANKDGFVADARQLNPNIENTLAWQVAKVNSDLGDIATNLSNVSTGLAATNIDLDPLKSNRVSHINSNVLNKVNIVLWDADTADTPFKAGNTNRGNGFCITYSSGEPYSCQLAMAVGDSHVFTRNSGPDGWSGWTTK